MADHADHHHAAPAKPNATTTMGIALFFGMATIIIALVGAVRNSHDILAIGLVTGIISIVVAILAVLIGKKKGESSRGFPVAVLLGIAGIAMWALVTNV